MRHECWHCGGSFESPYAGSRYCSTDCHFDYYVVKSATGWWAWNGVRAVFGYGKMIRQRRVVHAHRFAWQRENGPIPDGMFVLHHCDNPWCVKPDHLFLGTLADNIHDCMSKGRLKPPPIHIGQDNILVKRPELRPRGEKHHSNKLSTQQVFEIINSTGSCAEVGWQYGVSKSLVSQIRNRKCWKHLTPTMPRTRNRAHPPPG